MQSTVNLSLFKHIHRKGLENVSACSWLRGGVTFPSFSHTTVGDEVHSLRKITWEEFYRWFLSVYVKDIYKKAGEAPPKVLYTDRDGCSRHSIFKLKVSSKCNTTTIICSILPTVAATVLSLGSARSSTWYLILYEEASQRLYQWGPSTLRDLYGPVF